MGEPWHGDRVVRACVGFVCYALVVSMCDLRRFWFGVLVRWLLAWLPQIRIGCPVALECVLAGPHSWRRPLELECMRCGIRAIPSGGRRQGTEVQKRDLGDSRARGARPKILVFI